MGGIQTGYTALMIAASKGFRQCVSVLLVSGVDVNMADGVSAIL